MSRKYTQVADYSYIAVYLDQTSIVEATEQTILVCAIVGGRIVYCGNGACIAD